MSASASNGFVIVTQVYPQQSDTAAPPLYTAPNVSSVLGKFLKGEPKALGTVQILISVMVFLFGIVMVIYWDSIAAVSGIAFWGAIIYMVSGALTVAADNKLNKCLSRSHGITGVLLVFSILEFIVSICVSAFACKAVCHSTPEQVVFIQNPAAVVNTVTTDSLPMPKMYETMQIPNTTSNQNVLNDFNRN